MYPELAQFKNWLQCQYPNSSASVHYSSDLALFFSFVKKPPSHLTPQDVDNYVSHSLRQRHKPSTINRRLSAVRTFYYFLSMFCDASLACPVLPRHRMRKSYPLPRDVEDDRVQVLFSRIESPRDQAMFFLMLECGLRVGEVRSLSLDDLHVEDSPRLVVRGKGGKQRIVYLSPPVEEALRGWLASRPVSNDRAVFISEHGKRLSVAGIQYLLKGYCRKAGIHLTSHQLRHTFGRRMAEANLPLTSLQSLLGHKSVRTTQIYVHLSNTHLHAEYDRVIPHTETPPARCHAVCTAKRIPSKFQKAINWRGYLAGLPSWLTNLIRKHCMQRSGTNDPVQQTRNRVCQLSRFFRWMLSEYGLSYISEVTPRMWFSHVDLRLKAGIQPTSLNTALRALRSFLKFAKDSGYPICDRILEVRPLKTGENLPRDITEAQLPQLLSLANSVDQAWILLMAYSGLRMCEIRNLRWQNIDVKKRTVRIQESKGLRSRVVFLSPPTAKLLHRLPKTSEYVITYHYQPLSSGYCQSRLKTLGKKCGVTVTPHQLRHTCATILLNAGMSIFGVQAILGHKYVDTSLRYAHACDITVAKGYQQAMQSLSKKGAPDRYGSE